MLSVLLIVSLLSASSACPAPCMCKWKGGKQTAECGGHSLLSIPDGIGADTQVLNFSHNNLTVLQNERFQKLELINLQKIFLSNNHLMRIYDRAFRGLSNLVELDLSDNSLVAIPTETFQDYSSLMRLSLSGNPIRELKTSAFKYLSYLTTLELNNCQISAIEDEAFIGMDNLEWLKLDGNRIRSIRGERILPDSLNGISLHGNRWTCDCRLLDVYAWLATKSVPQVEEPRCFEPAKLQNHAIRTLHVDELACLPEMTPTTFYLEIAEGKNISLECKITAIPEAVISWWFQGQVLQNDTVIAPNLHLYYFIEENVRDDSKRSELFIYNANADDNGTFACVAENAAGRAQANFTIRVIVKEEPVVEEVSFPNEFLVLLVAGSGVLALLLSLCCCLLICRCRSGSGSGLKKKKKKKRKEVSFQLPTAQKCVAIASDINSSLVCAKTNGGGGGGGGHLTITDGSQLQCVNELCLPQDCNPDLINDAEGLRQRSANETNDDVGEKAAAAPEKLDEVGDYSLVPILRSIPLPRGGGAVNNGRDMYQVDVHLNPGCYIDAVNGFPLDYTVVNYKTLPHSRGEQRVKLNNSVVRFSNEAEFITRTSQTFQTFAPDIRYTAEGYPCVDAALDAQSFPSPPEGYKSSDAAMPQLSTVALLNGKNFCPNTLTLQQQQQQQQLPKWPSCLPGYHPQQPPQNVRYQMSPLQSPTTTTSTQHPLVVTKKCVGAQTSDVIHEQNEEEEEEEGEEGERKNNSMVAKCRQLKGPLADSPDEGYADDSQESSDI